MKYKDNIYTLYLGKIPNYFDYSIKLNSKKFNIILITDQKEYSNKLLSKIFYVDDIIHSDYLNELKKKIQKDMSDKHASFRDEFWIKTNLRFFIIYEFMKKNFLSNCLFFESDNLVFNLNPLHSVKDKSQTIYGLRISPNYMMPNIIYIKHISGIEKLCEYILANKKYSSDMTIMSKFQMDNPNILGQLNSEYDLFSKKNYHIQDFFDSASIGQYLFGVDPRNIGRPLYNLFINENINLDFKNFFFKIDDDYNNLKILYRKKEYQVSNLHIHSKIFKKLCVSSKKTNSIISRANKNKKTLIDLNLRNLKYLRDLLNSIGL